MPAIEANRLARLDHHDAEFRKLVERADRHLARGRLELAAVCAQIAARHAWLNHAGVFASPALENLLSAIGAELQPARAAAARESESRTVLHVATQLYQTGGSTQVLGCWIEQDHERVHRVCVTRQGSSPLPGKIAMRLGAPTDLVRLDDRRGGLLERATALRIEAGAADIVLLHCHPYDVVPVIAFSGAPKLPPVIYVNHADHVFWLGTSVASVVLSMRDSGQDLAIARRGIEAARSMVMARPLRVAGRDLSRDEAKRQLGVRPDQVLVVTAADASKYRSLAPPSLLEMLEPVFKTHEDALLLAAGPTPVGEWAAAERRTSGRIRALGRLPDAFLLHQAADLYVDSFPFSSLTSLLEAGSFGTPTLSYRGHPAECSVLGADTRSVDRFMLRPSTPEELRRDLSHVITNAQWRRDQGAKTRQAIIETHTGAGWRRGIDAVYATACKLNHAPCPGSAERATGLLDEFVDRVMTETRYSRGVDEVIRDHLGLLPFARRLAAWIRLIGSDSRPSARHLLPEWSLPHLAAWWRSRRRFGRVAARKGREASMKLPAKLPHAEGELWDRIPFAARACREPSGPMGSRRPGRDDRGE